MATALQAACDEMASRTAHLVRLRERFLKGLRATLREVLVNGPEPGGLPHTLNVSFPGCEAVALLMKLDLAGVACSAGAACASGSLLPSPVLLGMGLPPQRVGAAVRFSLGFQQTEEEINEAVRRIADAVRDLRRKDLS